MTLSLDQLLRDESERCRQFPVAASRIFLAHAGVTSLPRVVSDAMAQFAESGVFDQQEAGDFWKQIEQTRRSAAQLINAMPEEIALLGPTALGLNLVANGLTWEPGDEVIFYPDDYPANVYPWQNLASRGVKPVALHPAEQGKLTPELIFSALTPRTKLVALASCHFLSGYRLDYKTIGTELKKRGILFCLDGIQSLGATRLDCQYFDFLSADSHKWMLGPLGAGFFYVKQEHFERLQPTLLGSWNVQSPRFIAQPEIHFETTARRYEPGTLNGIGILGMKAGIDLLLGLGLEAIENQLLSLRAFTVEALQTAGWEVLHPDAAPVNASSIVTAFKPGADLTPYFQKLQSAKISVSLRWSRDNRQFLRLSPHFYNTRNEIEQVVRILLS